MKTNPLKSARYPFRVRGFRSRTAALLATMAICVCTAVRLEAVVIDDFENGIKFAEGGGGTNYFLWGLTNGQLVISKQNPVPTPPGSVLTTYDSVYWPAPQLPEGNLEGGRTLELRMDLNHLTADDLFFMPMCGGQYEGADTLYSLLIDRNEVALMKGGPSGFTTFYWDTLTTTNENVTVKLAFSKTNSSLVISVKIVDKGNQGVTLYHRMFVDGPGQDGPVPPPDPHGYGFVPDPGGAYPAFSIAAVGCSQMIFTSPPPLEMLLDNLEYDVYHPPHLEIAQATNGIDLTWQLPKEDYIVVSADQLAGPWCPCPQPYMRTGDGFCLTMSCQSQQKFFKLVPGRQFTDDFSGVKTNWMVFWPGVGDEWYVTNGVFKLKVFCTELGSSAGYLLLPAGSNFLTEDFCLSADILSWVISTNNRSQFSLLGRGRFGGPPGVGGEGYMAGLRLNHDDIPGNLALFIWDGVTRWDGPNFDIGAIPPPYRIEFSGVGNPICQLRLRVLNLTTGALIHQYEKPGTMFTEGMMGWYVVGRSDEFGRTFTITTDNCFMSGTKP